MNLRFQTDAAANCIALGQRGKRCATFMIMKNKLIITLFLTIGLTKICFAQDSTNIDTPRALGLEAFKAFKTNDFKLFYSLLITESEHENILSKMEVSDSLKTLYRKQGKGAIIHIKETAEQNFESILEDAKQINIDWSIAEVTEIQTEPRGKNNEERSDIAVHIKSGNTSFIILLSNCFRGTKWNIMDKVRLIPIQ